MRRSSIFVFAALIAACGGAEPSLPVVAAPVTPPITQNGAFDLAALGPTTFNGQPNDTTMLRVRATHADGSPAHAVTVVFQVQAGGGSVQPSFAPTDGEGIASVKWTFGPLAAVNLATATGGFAPSPVSFTASTYPADSTVVP